jgi:hypothetical protein
MRAHTITTISRRRRSARRSRVLALGLGICALAIPASASAYPVTGDPSSVNSITGGSSESSRPPGGSDPSSVNSIAPPASSPSGSDGSQRTDTGYSSVNAISGAPAGEPTLVTGAPAGTSDGFDWGSALVGAGAAMALAALGTAALLTVRRRPPVAPSAPAS